MSWLTATPYWIFKSVQKVCSAFALYRDSDPAIPRSGSMAELDWLLLHSAHKLLGPWEIRRPRYLTSSLDIIRAFFWDILYPFFARLFKVRRVFLSEVSLSGLVIKMSSTYYRTAPFFKLEVWVSGSSHSKAKISWESWSKGMQKKTSFKSRIVEYLLDPGRSANRV